MFPGNIWEHGLRGITTSLHYLETKMMCALQAPFFLLAVVRINVQSRGLAFLYILGANANYPSASLVPEVDQSMHIFTQIALWHGDCLKLRCCLDYRCTVRKTVHKPFLQALVVSPLAPRPAAGSERGWALRAGGRLFPLQEWQPQPGLGSGRHLFLTQIITLPVSAWTHFTCRPPLFSKSLFLSILFFPVHSHFSSLFFNFPFVIFLAAFSFILNSIFMS